MNPIILKLICDEITDYIDVARVRNMNRMSRIAIGIHFLLRKIIAGSDTPGAQLYICNVCNKLGADYTCMAALCGRSLCARCCRICCKCDYHLCPDHIINDLGIGKCPLCFDVRLIRHSEQEVPCELQISRYSGSVPVDLVRIIARHLAITDIIKVGSMSWNHHMMMEARISIGPLLRKPESGLRSNLCIGCRVRIPYLTCTTCDGEYCKECCFARCVHWSCMRDICKFCCHQCTNCGNAVCGDCNDGTSSKYICKRCARISKVE